MAKNTPVWAEKRLQKILSNDEQVMFEIKGRVDIVPATGIGALLFWIKYILINIGGIFYLTLFIRKTAWLVLTNKRIIILTNDSVNFPLWVIPFAYNNKDYILFKQNISSLNAIQNKILWFINGRGFQIETSGGLNIMFNGVNKEDYSEAQKKVFELIGK